MTDPQDTSGQFRRLGAPIRVLVVDDDEVDRERVRRLLAKSDIAAEITEAADPMAALAVVRRNAIDLIVLDYNFPRQDGMFVLRELREVGSSIPVVVLTGQDDLALAVELMKNGAADYIAKGALTAQRLATSVRHALRLRASELATRAGQEALRASEELVRRIIDVSEQCIKVLDVDGRLLLMSPRGLCQLGIPDFAEVRGRTWADLWPERHRREVMRAVDEARAGRTAQFVGLCPARGGAPLWWSVTVSPIVGPDGKPERLLAVSRSVGAP